VVGFQPAAPDSGIFMLAEYLASANAKLLEQEELDPRILAVCDGATMSLKLPYV
jgi:hypothetical protein